MENYKIKDVVFGLRSEYIEIAKMLKELESQLSVIENEKVDFSIIRDENILDLKIGLLKRESLLLKLIQKLGKNVSSNNEYRMPLHNLYEGGEHGLIISDERLIKLPEQPNGFYELADSVLSRPFVNNEPHFISIEQEDGDFQNSERVDIYPLGVNVDAWEKYKDNSKVPSEFLAYVMSTDSINYSAYRDLALRTDLNTLLNTPVDSSELNKTEKLIIKNSNILNKNVKVVNESILVDNQSFSIEDTPSEIILKRK